MLIGISYLRRRRLSCELVNTSLSVTSAIDFIRGASTGLNKLRVIGE